MTSFTSLLAGTDFSIHGNNAVRRAAMLAREHGARLHIQNVIGVTGCQSLRDTFFRANEIELRAAQARGALQRLAIELAGAYDVAPTIEVLVGQPSEALLRASEQADLVVLGRSGRSRLLSLLAGGTADRLLRACPRPVLVVRTSVERSYRRVLVPIDFSALSDAAIRVAAQIRGDAGMRVFHCLSSRRDAVLRDADVPEHIIRETRLMEEAGTNARMRRHVAGLSLDCTSVSFALAYGPAVRSTLRHARQLGADLLVVGKPGRPTARGFLVGSVGSRLLSAAECDMMIVPRPRDVPAPRAAATAASRLKSQVHADNAALTESTAGPAEAITQGHWIHKTARFVSRRVA